MQRDAVEESRNQTRQTRKNTHVESACRIRVLCHDIFVKRNEKGRVVVDRKHPPSAIRSPIQPSIQRRFWLSCVGEIGATLNQTRFETLVVPRKITSASMAAALPFLHSSHKWLAWRCRLRWAISHRLVVHRADGGGGGHADCRNGHGVSYARMRESQPHRSKVMASNTFPACCSPDRWTSWRVCLESGCFGVELGWLSFWMDLLSWLATRSSPTAGLGVSG